MTLHGRSVDTHCYKDIGIFSASVPSSGSVSQCVFTYFFLSISLSITLCIGLCPSCCQFNSFFFQVTMLYSHECNRHNIVKSSSNNENKKQKVQFIKSIRLSSTVCQFSTFCLSSDAESLCLVDPEAGNLLILSGYQPCLFYYR